MTVWFPSDYAPVIVVQLLQARYGVDIRFRSYDVEDGWSVFGIIDFIETHPADVVFVPCFPHYVLQCALKKLVFHWVEYLHNDVSAVYLYNPLVGLEQLWPNLQTPEGLELMFTISPRLH